MEFTRRSSFQGQKTVPLLRSVSLKGECLESFWLTSSRVRLIQAGLVCPGQPPRQISRGGHVQAPRAFQWSESYCKLLPASTHYLLLSFASPGGLRPSDHDAVGVSRLPVAAEARHALVCPDPLVRSVVPPEGGQAAEQLPPQTP